MADDLFETTQPVEVEGNMYEEMACAIAIKKCRVVQKRENIKLMIDKLKKLDEELRLTKEKNKILKREKEEVDRQEQRAVTNLKRAKESRAALEATLSDLNSKIEEAKAETEKKREFYKAHMDDARSTWKSYEKKYNEFPLAKEMNALKLDLKKVELNVRLVQSEGADAKRRELEQRRIKEKMFYAWGVNLAKQYFELKKQEEKRNSSMKTIRELKQTIEDFKSGKKTKKQSKDITENILKSSLGKAKTPPKGHSPLTVSQFQMPELPQIFSPPPSEETGASLLSCRSIFDWSSLLSSSNSVFAFSNEVQSKKSDNVKKNTTLQLNISEDKNKQAYEPVAVEQGRSWASKLGLNIEPVKSALRLSKNSASALLLQKKTEALTGTKRKFTEVEDISLPMTVPSQNRNPQTKAQGPTDVSQDTQNQIIFENNNKETQLNDVPVLMDPTSPPDIVPVENNSQPLSQNADRTSQPFSDYMSPVELTDKERLIYEQISAESPDFTYAMGPNMISSSKPSVKISEPVRSEYFPDVAPTNPSSSSLNTPPMEAERETYQRAPLSPDFNSPPNSALENYQPYSPNIASPPCAALGSFDPKSNMSYNLFGKAPADEGNKQQGGSFSFSFNSGAKSSNVFNLFG